MYSMSEIKILPIFDQSAPNVWTDFLRVRIAAMKSNHNVELSDQEISDALAEYAESWRRLSCSFAFGAFDGDKMIGYINGDCQRGISYLRHLYVLPEYQGRYLGYGLLKAAENTSSIYARKTDIVALPGAEKFYKKYGYVSPCGTNWYTKDIHMSGKCSVTPIFNYTKPVIRACADLAAGVALTFDNKKRVPLFVYRDAANKITAFGAIEQDGVKTFSQSKSPDDWARHSINRSIENYLSYQKM